jgi:hypothetical protein
MDKIWFFVENENNCSILFFKWQKQKYLFSAYFECSFYYKKASGCGDEQNPKHEDVVAGDDVKQDSDFLTCIHTIM